MTPHQRIVRAARRGTGCRFTREEIAYLASDGAIADRACVDDLEDDRRRTLAAIAIKHSESLDQQVRQ